MDPSCNHPYSSMTHETMMCLEDKPEDVLANNFPFLNLFRENTIKIGGYTGRPRCPIVSLSKSIIVFERLQALTANKRSQTFSIDRPRRSSVKDQSLEDIFSPPSASTSPVPLFRSHDNHISRRIIVHRNLQITSKFLPPPKKKHAVEFDFRHTANFSS